LRDIVEAAKAKDQTIHFLPPYRHDHQILLEDLLGIKPAEQRDKASLPLIKAFVDLRSTKSEEEIKEIERACAIGRKMHITAMKLCQPGVTEHFIGGMISGIAEAFGAMVSFQSIVSMHGEVMHGYPEDRHLEAGRLMLCDAGAETVNHYCSDNTRTTPISGKYTNRQKEIYTIVEECHDLALRTARPGVLWYDVHMEVCKHIIDRLKELGLMRGDTEEAAKAGAHALFLPHGLGHMMGMDVHDMEALGQQYVGYDDEIQPSTQFGTASLRMGRRLQKGFVVTDEPGIYFIPALIDLWKKNGTNAEFLNFNAIEKYKDFGGIRIEDDLLITDDGARILGKDIIPYHINDVEDFLAKNRY
jgi:Xaa-Pro dipeptidase